MADAAWRKKLRPGKFRGVPFFCESAEQELGRRIVLHEYPLRSNPYPEDLGRKTRTHDLVIFVLGPDYMVDRDRMIDALEEEGAGTLAHPYRGELRVVVTSARVAESKDEGGMARFTLTFVEDAENVAPIAMTNTVNEVENAADIAEEAAAVEFEESFSIDGLPQFAIDDALEQMNSVLQELEDLRMSLTPDLSLVNDVVAMANNISYQALSLLGIPGNLASRLTSLFTGTFLTADTSRTAARSIMNLLSGEKSKAPPVAAADTPTRKRQKTNAIAMERYTQRLYLVELVRNTARSDFVSRDEAIEHRDEVIDLVQAELEDPSIDIDTYQSFARLLTTLTTHVAVQSAQLARVSYVTLREPEPALVTAYAVYGNVSRVDEIVDRNGIEHPAFMPAGTPLEVLNG